MISVVYDANVLFSGSLRDLLMQLAVTRVVRAFWSDDIHEEWIRSLLKKRPGLTRERLERTRRRMDEHSEGSLVYDYQDIIPTLRLPDPNDRHVLAAAIRAGATVIVTYNRDDFPSEILSSYGIEAISPDEFVIRLTQNKATEVLEAARFHRESLTRPSKSVDDYLATLENQRLPKTVAFLREHRDEI